MRFRSGCNSTRLLMGSITSAQVPDTFVRFSVVRLVVNSSFTVTDVCADPETRRHLPPLGNHPQRAMLAVTHRADQLEDL